MSHMPQPAGTEIDLGRIADFALRLVAVPSPSGSEGAVAAIVAEEMARLGLQVERDELGNITGTLDAGPGPCILLDAHMDTVGVGDRSGWSHCPDGEIVDGQLYGRGAMDMKGPLAACLHGVASLRGRVSRGRVVVSATVAEEFVEGPALMAVAERTRPEAVVICEATSLRLARGQRGRAEVRLEAQGRATHSSRPELGINAVTAMVDAVVALRQLALPRHEVLGQAILVITDVISSPYPGLSVIPERCIATFDRRTLPGETEQDILGEIQGMLGPVAERTGAFFDVRIAEDRFHTYTGREMRAANFAPAWFYGDDSSHVRAALRGLHDAGLDGGLSHYAFCTNGSGTAGRLNVPTLGFGPGDEELAHRADERIPLEALHAAANGYAGIVQRLLDQEF